MMRIHHAPRTRSLRVVWAAEELGVPYETTPVSFQNPSPEFLALSPGGTIPAVEADDVRMTESVAIIHYLAVKHGSPLAVAPEDRRYADYLQFLLFGEANLAAPLNAIVGTRFMGPEEEKNNWTVQMIGQSYERRLAPVVRQLERGDYMAGDAFTMADISVGYALGLGEMLQVCEHPAPIKAYRERLTSRPADQRAAAVT